MIKKVLGNPFARNSLILFIGTMVANALGYFYHLVAGRMVSITVYGEAESLLSLISIISVPSVALSMAVVRYGAAYKARNDLAGSVQFFRFVNGKVLIWTLPSLLLGFILVPLLKDFLKIENSLSLSLVWVMMLLSFLSAVAGGMLSAWQRFSAASWSGVIGALIKLLGLIVLIKFGFELIGILGGYLLGVLAAYLVAIYYLYGMFKVKREAVSPFRSINVWTALKYLMPMFFGNLALAILSNADMVLAKHNLDAISAGQYGALTITAKIIFFATGSIAPVLFSMSAEKNHRQADSSRMLTQSIYAISAIAIGSVIVYFLVPGFILSLMFGQKYNEVANLLGWFAISIALFSLVNIIFQYLLSVSQDRAAYSLLGVSVLSVSAIMFFGQTIFGIIILTLLSQLAAVIIGFYHLYSKKIYA